MVNPLIEKIAKAIHDGPLMADEHDFDGQTPQETKASEWCKEVARAALSVIRENASELVKPLVWEGDPDEEFTSCGSFCTYRDDNNKLVLMNGDIEIGKFDELGAAKTAAWELHVPYALSLLNMEGE